MSNIGDLSNFPAKKSRDFNPVDFNPAEWTRCLIYDGTPGTRDCLIPPDMVGDEVLVVVKSGSGSGAARHGAGDVSGAAGGGFAMAIVGVKRGSKVPYTVGAGGPAIVQNSAGATAGTTGGTSSFGSAISVTGGEGGKTDGTAATGGVPTINSARKVIATANGGASGVASGGGSSATGGGGSGTPIGTGRSSGAAVSTNPTDNAASGGGGCFAASGDATDTVTGGAGTTASSGRLGGGPSALFGDAAAATYSGSPAVPAAALIEYLLTGAALADGVPTATNDGWNSISASPGRSGGTSIQHTASAPTGTNVARAGDGGHFGGGGAARVSLSNLAEGTHTARGGDGGRHGGGGGAVIDATSSPSGGTINAIGGAGRLGGGGGAAVAEPGAGVTAVATSGQGGDGLVAVFTRELP